MQQMLNVALVIAAKAHDGQFDKAGKPYLLHVLAVMANLNSDDEELNCVAVLHDTIEDTAKKPEGQKVTYKMLLDNGMSQRVVDAVKLLTKVPGQDNEDYVEGLLTNEDAMLVKKADLTHNMDLKRLKGVTDKDMERMNKYIRTYHRIDYKLKYPDADYRLADLKITFSA